MGVGFRVAMEERVFSGKGRKRMISGAGFWGDR